MRNGLIGIVTATALACSLATVGGCGSNSNGGGAGGSSNAGGSSSTGGTSGSGGVAGSGGNSNGGNSGSGGTKATGGSATGGASSTGGSAGGSSGTGGSSGGSSGGSITTVSGSKTLGSLSADESTQLCNDTYAYFNKNVSQAIECKWMGLFYAASSSAPSEDVLRQGCTDHETACLKVDAGAGAIANPGCDAPPSKCTITVAQYSTCISDHTADFVKTVQGLSTCATLTRAGTTPVQDAEIKDLPASCMTISTNCPALSIPNLFAQ